MKDTKQNFFIKNKKTLIIIAVILLIAIIIGITYALWQITFTQGDKNRLVGACIDTSFSESGADITLASALPITDEEGAEQSPHTFTITNNCSADYAAYQVNIENLEGTTLSDSNIKIKLDGEYSLLNENNSVEKTLSNAISSRSLKTGQLAPGQSKTFELRLWLDYAATAEEAANKSYSGKITIITSPSEKPNTLMVVPSGTTSYNKTFLNSPAEVTREKIESIEFTDTKKVPEGVIGSWDVSENQNKSLMAWYKDEDNNNLYEITIGGNGGVKANVNSANLFGSLYNLKFLILNDNFDTSNTTKMNSMFYRIGYNSTELAINLGNEFDTSNVTNMSYMFQAAGNNSNKLAIDLGNKFDTSNVTNMQAMFNVAGYRNTEFTLDLGSNFNTKNVTNMSSMFMSTGVNSTSFVLDLGNNFDTGNVSDMEYMFKHTGSSSLNLDLNLGNNFDTKNVTNMREMFYYTGYSDTSFTLDLGNKFNTSEVGLMSGMFAYTGFSSTIFTLDLGEEFDTSSAYGMDEMFSHVGYNNINFTLDLGDNFFTSNLTNAEGMFAYTGYNSAIFTLDLGDNFDTGYVTNMNNMFDHTGYSSANFTLDLGYDFDVMNALNMDEMFQQVGNSNANFFINAKNTTWSVSAWGDDVTRTNIFNGSKSTHKFYAMDATEKAFIESLGFAGTVYDCSSITCP